MRTKIIIAAVLVLLFDMVVQADSHDEGLKYLKLARKARANENGNEEKSFLQSAFREFKRNPGGESLLPLVYTGLQLKRKPEVDRYAAEFIKSGRRMFLQSVFQNASLNLEEKQDVSEYLNELSGRIPFIDDVKVKGNGFYPYRKQSPVLSFTLQADASCSLSLESDRVREARCNKGEVLFPFAWQENYFGQAWLNTKIESKNELTSVSVSKRIKVSAVMPKNLYYSEGSFGIMGKQLKSETKVVKKRNILYLLGAAACGVLAITSKSKSTDNATYLLLGGISLGAAYFTVAPKVTVQDNRAIKYNRQLMEDIEEKKSDVQVNLEIQDGD